MKKLIVLIALMAPCAAASFAQSVLRVHLADDSRFNISVNGRYFDRGGQSITVGDLPPGIQRVKIYTVVQSRRGQVYEELVYNGTIRTRYGMITNFQYDPYNHTMDMTMDDMNSRQTAPSPTGQPDDNGMAYNDNNGSNNNNYNQQPANNNMQDNNNNSYDQQAGNGAPAASPLAADKTGSLTDAKSEMLKAQVDAAAHDTKKMAILKDGLRGEKLTTYDVSYMMDWFIFETSKVDFAKWAYSLTQDKEFYSDLDAKLKTKSYKDELSDFIRSHQ